MEHTSSNVVREKSKAFAIRTIRFVRYLQTEKKDFVLSNQILRSGTSLELMFVKAKMAKYRRFYKQVVYRAQGG